MKRFQFFIGLLLLIFCSCHLDNSAAADGGVISPKTLQHQREASRKILLGLRCRSCHDGRLKTAIPEALKIFDLSNKDWDRTMTTQQYEGALRRTLGEKSLNSKQQMLFKSYVETQITRQEGMKSGR